MFQLNESISLGQRENLAALYYAVGPGIFSGLLSAGLAHLINGEPTTGTFFMMAFSGGFMFTMRGWKEFCALLAMLGTFVAYFAVCETFRLDSSLIVSIVLSVLAVGLFVVYIPWMVDLTTKIRAISLGLKDKLSTREAMSLPLQDTEQWLLGLPMVIYRVIAAVGKPSSLQMIICLSVYRLLMLVTGLLSTIWFDNVLVASLGASVFVYQLVAVVRLARFMRRVGQLSVEKVLEEDLRPPVLLLRPFNLDELVLSPFIVGWRGFEYMVSMERRTFEEYLAAVFNDIGPVIAIGRPGEVAAPIGAAREYLDDASWQQRVLERADAAKIVIMICDATPGMRWEIQNVPERVGLRRIVLVLPLGEDGEAKRSPEWHKRWDTLRREFNFLPKVSEEAIAILFNEDGDPIVLSANTASLQKRIAMIKDAWLYSA